MLKIRIGNDIPISWSFYTVEDGERKPYIIEGKDVRIFMIDDFGNKDLVTPDISENVASWIFYGMNQKRLGSYSFSFYENINNIGMKSLDKVQPFELVGCQEEIQSGTEYGSVSSIDVTPVTLTSIMDEGLFPVIYGVEDVVVNGESTVSDNVSFFDMPFVRDEVSGVVLFGANSKASGAFSIADGYGTKATNDYEHASGRFNVSRENTLFSIGIGSSDSDRNNAFEMIGDGGILIKGIGGFDGSSVSDVKTLQDVINYLKEQILQLTMEYRITISSGDCFKITRDKFAISETLSGYTLYCSIKCPTPEIGKQEWIDAGGNIPDGWKEYSKPIPANTMHVVHNAVPGMTFFLKDMTDSNINVIW